MYTMNIIKGIIMFFFIIILEYNHTLYGIWRIKFIVQRKILSQQTLSGVMVTITVAIYYCFLLQWTAIILWYIITNNYFKLNKRCATVWLTKWKRNNNKKQTHSITEMATEAAKNRQTRRDKFSINKAQKWNLKHV